MIQYDSVTAAVSLSQQPEDTPSKLGLLVLYCLFDLFLSHYAGKTKVFVHKYHHHHQHRTALMKEHTPTQTDVNNHTAQAT